MMTYNSLLERYQDMEDDELIDIYCTYDLTELAIKVIKEELRSRNIDTKDFQRKNIVTKYKDTKEKVTINEIYDYIVLYTLLLLFLGGSLSLLAGVFSGYKVFTEIALYLALIFITILCIFFLNGSVTRKKALDEFYKKGLMSTATIDKVEDSGYEIKEITYHFHDASNNRINLSTLVSDGMPNMPKKGETRPVCYDPYCPGNHILHVRKYRGGYSHRQTRDAMSNIALSSLGLALIVLSTLYVIFN